MKQTLLPIFPTPSIELLQGDCLEVMRGLADGSVDMVMADPPYGTTACKWDSIIPLEPMWVQLKRVIKPNGAIVLTASQPFTTTLISSNMGMFQYCWVWHKNRPTGFPNANHRPLRDCEDVVVFSLGKSNPAAKIKTFYKPQGIIKKHETKSRTAKNTTVNNGERDGSLNGVYVTEFCNYPRQIIEFDSEWKTVHPTQKPVALMEYLIKTYTNKGETVLDFCMGSGTTGVACKNLNRNFIGIEKDPEYFKIAKDRLDQAT